MKPTNKLGTQKYPLWILVYFCTGVYRLLSFTDWQPFHSTIFSESRNRKGRPQSIIDAPIACPALCQAPWGQKEDCTPHSKRLQSVKEIIHRPRIRELGEHHMSKLTAGIQKRKAGWERLNGGNELEQSHEQSLDSGLQKEGRNALWGWAGGRWDKNSMNQGQLAWFLRIWPGFRD